MEEISLERLGAATVLSLEGRVLQMSELWQIRTSVVAFVRHFGCLFCHELVAKLRDAQPAILSRGAQLVIVGNGSIDQARTFFTGKGVDIQRAVLVTDPSRETYRAAGMRRGLGVTFANRGSLQAFSRAQRAGHRITGAFGDVFQLGGVLVARPPEQLVYSYVSRFAGDDPDMAAVVAALD